MNLDWLPRGEDGQIDGPVVIFGYDGKIHPERAGPSDWRKFWMRRARAMGEHTQKEWRELRDRIGRCMSCGAVGVPLTKDHIIPVSRGGCDCIDNIQPLCGPCNSSKGASI